MLAAAPLERAAVRFRTERHCPDWAVSVLHDIPLQLPRSLPCSGDTSNCRVAISFCFGVHPRGVR
jgi:hypothetical protein